ncbi:MAG: substrate-binding domain-containing protein [Sodalis sp. (in: enterobacteria)]|uniref:substrate-binding domain-containing protein n=1 Tax=Sodalis sp. (in: enterobacteria) TaxID=1898979 RepID=UPI003F2CE9D3
MLSALRRTAGYCAMPLPVERSRWRTGGISSGDGALHREAPQVDGVLILVDTFATGAVRAFNQLGVSIPEHMRIATRYDGIRARETWPGLTAVNLHLDEVARLTIEQLFMAMSGQSPQRPCQNRSGELVIRRSTCIGARITPAADEASGFGRPS